MLRACVGLLAAASLLGVAMAVFHYPCTTRPNVVAELNANCHNLPSDTWTALSYNFPPNTLNVDISGLPRGAELYLPTRFLTFNQVSRNLNLDINRQAIPNMAIEVLIRLRSINNNRGWMISHDNSNFDRSILLHDDRFANRIAIGRGLPSGTPGEYASTLPQLEPGQWVHIVAQWGPNGGTYKQYANFTHTQMVLVNNDDGWTSTTLGNNPSFALHRVDIDWAYVRIWDKLLNDADVEALWNDALASITLDKDAPVLNVDIVSKDSSQITFRLQPNEAGQTWCVLRDSDGPFTNDYIKNAPPSDGPHFTFVLVDGAPPLVIGLAGTYLPGHHYHLFCVSEDTLPIPNAGQTVTPIPFPAPPSGNTCQSATDSVTLHFEEADGECDLVCDA